MEKINIEEIYEASTGLRKDKLQEFCSKQGIEIKDLTAEVLSEIISDLEKVRDKVISRQILENKDWTRIAIEFHSIINILLNNWHCEEDKD